MRFGSVHRLGRLSPDQEVIMNRHNQSYGSENDNLREGDPPRPKTEPDGKDGSPRSSKTKTDPASGQSHSSDTGQNKSAAEDRAPAAQKDRRIKPDA